MLKKIVLMAVTTVATFAMHNAEININNQDLELGVQMDMGQFNDTVDPNTIFIGAKWLKVNAKHSQESNVYIDPYFEVSLLMMQDIKRTPFRLGLGIKLNRTKDFASAPLGIEAAFLIPARDLVPMRINGAVYYATPVLSFRDADNFFEARIALDIEVIKNGNVTVGYRNIETNYQTNNGNFRYNRSAYIGFKLNF